MSNEQDRIADLQQQVSEWRTAYETELNLHAQTAAYAGQLKLAIQQVRDAMTGMSETLGKVVTP